MRNLVIILCLIAFVFTTAPAQNRQNVEYIDDALRLPLYTAVTISGDYAYCATGYGVRTVSLHDIRRPIVISDVATPGEACDVLAHNGYLYVADGTNGLVVCSLDDPGFPEIVNTIKHTAHPQYLSLLRDGNMLYVTEGMELVFGAARIFSLENPAAPEYIKGMNISYGDAWMAQDSIKYLVREGRLIISSMHDLDSTFNYSILDLDFAGSVVLKRGDYVFISARQRSEANEPRYLVVVSVADPANPSVVAELEGSHGSDVNMFIYDHYLYIYNFAFTVIDIANPERPSVVGERTFSFGDYEFYGQYKISCHPSPNWGSWDFKITSYANPLQPQAINSLSEPGTQYELEEVAVYNGRAYVCRNRDLYRITIGDFDHPVHVGINDGGTGTPTIYNDYLFVNSIYNERTVLTLYSLLDPDNPRLVWQDRNDVYPNNYAIGNNILVGCGFEYDFYTYSLDIYDISNPEQISLLSSTEMGGLNNSNSGRPQIIDTLLYKTWELEEDNPELLIYSLANPREPQLIGRIPELAGGYVVEDLVFMNKRLYRPPPPYGVVDGYGLKVYRLLGGSNFEVVDSITVSRVIAPTIEYVEGRTLFVSCGTEGFKVISFEDPENPEITGWCDTHYKAHGIAVDGNIAAVTDERSVGFYDISRLRGAWYLQLAETSHDFGTVGNDSVGVWEMSVRNLSAYPRTIDGIRMEGDGSFWCSNDSVHTIPASDTTRLIVNFVPDADTTYSGTLLFDTGEYTLRVGLTGRGRVINSIEQGEPIAREFALYQPFPNPFNSTTRIRYSLPQVSDVSLKLYDTNGREIWTMMDGKARPAGSYTMALDGRDLPAGLYLVRLTAGREVKTAKVVLMR